MREAARAAGNLHEACFNRSFTTVASTPKRSLHFRPPAEQYLHTYPRAVANGSIGTGCTIDEMLSEAPSASYLTGSCSTSNS